MKPVFKCDYCTFMGTEEEVRKHEPTCIYNYDKKSCYTCQHKGKLNMVNHLVKYECCKGIDVPEGRVFEYCKSYERRNLDSPTYDFMKSIFRF